MAISIDWPTGVISVPQADITFVSGTLYELDTDWFRLQLRALEASESGMPWPPTHSRKDSTAVAGTTIAQVIEIINGYSVQFTPDSQWTVRLVGSNNNIFDVENGILVQNQVQVIPGNSAGLIETQRTSGLTSAESQAMTEIHRRLGLDADVPVVVETGRITIGSMVITMTGDGVTSITQQRQ